MIVLSLGSNMSSELGNRFDNLEIAISFLESCQIPVIKKSSFYETPAYPNKNDPKFINMIVLIKTDLPPIDLMSVLIYIEEKLGRKRNVKNEPRSCDIDIIDYNGQILDLNYKNIDFVIPHKKIEFRNFVLYPLREILPDWKHPKTKQNVSTLIKKLPEDDRKSILMVKK